MISKQSFYLAICDDCGETFSTEDEFTSLEPTKSDLLERLEEHEWLVIGRKCYCASCRPKHEKK